MKMETYLHRRKGMKENSLTSTASRRQLWPCCQVIPRRQTMHHHHQEAESEAIDIREYQQLTGDIIYLKLANTAIPYAISAVPQKTQHCTKREYETVLHILQYINGHRKQGLIFRRAPVGHRPPRLTDILRMPISIYFCTDGAQNAVTTHDSLKISQAISTNSTRGTVHSSNGMCIQDPKIHLVGHRGWSCILSTCSQKYARPILHPECYRVQESL